MTTLTIELRPETEAGLAILAAGQSVSVAEYVQRLLEHQVAVFEQRARSPAERATAWRDAAKGLPHTPLLSDAAISRESMYDPRA